MKKILIIGAGRSASSLIKYLLNKSEEEAIQITEFGTFKFVPMLERTVK